MIEEIFSEVSFADKVPLKILKFRADKHNWKRGWETEYISELIETLKPGMTVFDVGAENGEFGALAAKIVGGENVHLFEPSPSYWPNVKALWGINKFANPGGMYQVYIDEKTDPLLKYYLDIEHEKVLLMPPFLNEIFEETNQVVPANVFMPPLTIDDYCEMRNVSPSVIMMDIEGAELAAVRGAKKTIERCAPIFFISVHNEELIESRSDGGFSDLFKLLTAHGYEAKHIYTDHEAHWKFYKK